MSKQLHICALGSSFAAGPGIPPIIDKYAMRSGSNYAHLLASKLDAKLTDLTVSGATLENILDQPQVAYGHRFEPQLHSLPPDVDIVTITAGGNDMSYIGGAMQAEIESATFGNVLKYLIPELVKETRLRTADAIAARFVAIIDAIRKVAPKARIFLIEYLTLFGNDTVAGKTVWMSEEKIAENKKIGKTLNEGYRLAGEARPDYCEVVPMAELSEGHGLGSEGPWVDGFTLQMMLHRLVPFHPNGEGHKAVANILYARIQAAATGGDNKGGD